jgi:hypothetical protein
VTVCTLGEVDMICELSQPFAVHRVYILYRYLSCLMTLLVFSGVLGVSDVSVFGYLSFVLIW